ncbi:uncharacterized protein LOC144118301 [Amblyomma americanum]
MRCPRVQTSTQEEQCRGCAERVFESSRAASAWSWSIGKNRRFVFTIADTPRGATFSPLPRGSGYVPAFEAAAARATIVFRGRESTAARQRLLGDHGLRGRLHKWRRSAQQQPELDTNEKEARLISLYGMYRLLWDNRHPEYYKKDSREQAINAIAQGLDNDFNVVNVKEKIKSLRDYFVKELRKEAASRKSPALRPYVSRWEHFRSWDFLRSVVCCDPSVQSPPTVDLPSGPLDGLHCVIDAMLPTLVRPRASRRTGVKRERQEMYPGFFDAEGPDVILPSSPECSSDEDEVRPNSRKTGSSSPPPPSVPQESGSSGLAPQDHALARPQPKTEQRSSPSPPSYPARDSVMSPNPPPARRAHLSRSPDNIHFFS